MKRLFILFVHLLILIFLLHPVTATANSSLNISEDKIVSDFPKKLTFKLSLSSSKQIREIKLLYRTNGAACQSSVARQAIEFTPAASVDVEWEWDFTRAGVLPPGAEIYWQWQITDADGDTQITDEQSYLVYDPRHTWNLLTSGQVNLQWYDGNASFGQTLVNIASQSLDRLAEDAGVRPIGQIWITIYPTVEELQEVDIHTSEWAGGLAYTEYNSSMIAIGSDELAWASSVIPHEVAHLVTESVIFNCKGVRLPTWLGEGLSMYAEGPINQIYIDLVTSALEKSDLPPLRTLDSGFSSISSEASLSYGHSGMMVTYLIDKYGAQKMADLLEAVKSGQVINKALQGVYGKDTDAMEAEWRISLGFEPQPTLVPTSSSKTAVPTLALWTSVVRPRATPTSLATDTPTLPPPTETPEPITSPTLIASSGSSSATDPVGSKGSSSAALIEIIIGSVVLIAIVGFTLFIIIKRRRNST